MAKKKPTAKKAVTKRPTKGQASTPKAAAEPTNPLTPAKKAKQILKSLSEGMTKANKVMASGRPRERSKHDNVYALVLAEGTYCESQKRPAGIRKKKIGLCFSNAWSLCTDNPAYTYVEGFVWSHGFPIHHAWVVDGENRVIDNTLPDPEDRVYYGIKFDTQFVARLLIRKRKYTVIDPMDEVGVDLFRNGLPEEAKAKK